MGDIENAKNKLESLGYVHPKELKPTTTALYQTLNTEDKKAKYQSSSSYNDPYKRFDNNVNETEVQKTNICPVCNTEALYACECEIGDMMCKNNHHWWVNNKGKIVKGDPHEDEDED